MQSSKAMDTGQAPPPPARVLDRAALAARAWWIERLARETAESGLPLDHPRGGRRRTATLQIDLGPGLDRRLAERTGGNPLLAYTALLAAVLTALDRPQRNGLPLAVGSPALRDAGAPNALALVQALDGAAPFRQLLLDLRQTLLDSYERQQYPFERLVQELGRETAGDRSPLFDLAVALEDLHGPLPDVLAEGGPDASLLFSRRDGRLAVRTDYRADLLRADTVHRFVEAVRRALEAGLGDPGLRIADLRLPPGAERHLVLREWNDTADGPHADCFHTLFEAQVERTPDAPALIGPEGTLTYRELDRRANRLAHALRARGVGPEIRVGLLLGRSFDLVAALLAVHKAGGAYVPLDPAYPRERLAFMAADSGLSLLLAHQRLATLLPPSAVPVIRLDAEEEALTAGLDGDARPCGEPLPGSAAYVLYTSGSTGQPKGVLIEHRGLCNAARAELRELALGPGNRVLQFFSWGFDASVYEMNMTLLSGAALCLVPAEKLLGAELVRAVHTWAIDTLSIAPSALATLPEEELRGLRTLTVLGEACPRELIARWEGGRRIFNAYGPTEASMWVAGGFLDSGRRPPIGRPILGARIHLVDADLEPVPVGVPGELVVAGVSLARGYLNRPDLTAERFVPDPLGEAPGERLYRTGDLARWLPDGCLDYLGRIDHQIKIRGFRVELGEVEAALLRHPGVREAAVLARRGEDGTTRDLVAYVVAADTPENAGRPAARELRGHLGRDLPDFMVPAHVVFLDALPLNTSGKLDRKALPDPGAGRPELDEVYLAPETALENAIAQAWREVLGVDRVGLRDNFFELGGSSLLLVRLAERLTQTLGREVTVTQLFRSPTVAALAEQLAPETPAAQERGAVHPAPEPGAATGAIAVVGLAGRFPGARDVDELWRNLRDGVESITVFSRDELAAAGFPPELLDDPRLVAARGVLEGVDQFDAEHFGYTPREAQVMDPQQRIFLECAWTALEDAGCDPERHPGRIGVYAGCGFNTYMILNLLPNRDLLATGASDFQGVILNDKDFLPTRVAYKLGLRGPAVNVQTACSTSLAAVHLACKSLLAGECDLALAGGVSLKIPQVSAGIFQPGGILSPDGHCRAFDAEARGTVGASGAGVVALKRLADALADGDTIRAVIRGSALANDGADKVGFTAPSVMGQAAALAGSYTAAGIDPSTVDYVEAHGTATELGDPVEVAALAEVFRDRSAEEPLLLGSIKTNIGHLDAAAGVAGLIKTVLALEHRQIPPSLHFKAANPRIDFAGRFAVAAALTDWPQREGRPRRAGVSSFGIGGTNVHAVLEEAPTVPADPPARAWQLLTLSARTPSALDTLTASLADALRTGDPVRLADAAFTLHVGRRRFARRRIAVVRGGEDAAAVLADPASPRVRTGGREDGAARPLLALFSGQAGCAAELARARLFLERGLRPRAVAGRGAGELAAACFAGLLTPEEAARLAGGRGPAPEPRPARLPFLAGRTGTWVREGETLPAEHWTAADPGEDLLAAALAALREREDPAVLEIPGPGEETEEALLGEIGRLWIEGVEIDWAAFHAGERRRRIPLPTYPFERRRHWVDPRPHAEERPAARQDVGEWFYVPGWTRTDTAGTPPPAGSRWLLLAGESEPSRNLAARWAERLERAGCAAVVAPAGGDPEALLQNLPDLAGAAYLGGLGPGGDGAEAFDREMERGVLPLLALLQALGRRRAAGPLRLAVVADRLHKVTAADRPLAGRAPLLSLCLVAPQERPSLSCRAIDIEPVAPGSAAEERLLDLLVSELGAPAGEPAVALRGGERWLQTFSPLPTVHRAGRPALLRQGGVYLITGGLGRIGLEIARLLAREVGARLVLTGRTPLPARGDWDAWLAAHPEDDRTSLRLRALRDLETLGAEVRAVAADAADPEAMHRALEAARELGELRGVIHAAGVVEEDAFHSLAQTGAPEIDRHFRPKVRGLHVLDGLLHGRGEVDFVLLLSSLSTVLGGLGFTAYAAANQVLDSWAEARAGDPGPRWLSVDWDGLALRSGAATGGSTEAFRRLLDAPAPRVVVSARDLETGLRRWRHLETARGAAGAAPSPPAAARPRSAAAAHAPADGELERRIAALWRRVLGHSEIDVHDNFFDLGGSSLDALDLVDEVQRELGAELSTVEIFEAPTVSAQAALLRPRIGGSAAVAAPPEPEPVHAPAPPPPAVRATDIAVIALAGRFPGARTAEDLWRNLRAGVESLTAFTDEELRAAGVEPELLAHPDFVRLRPILDSCDELDAAFFGLTPREAEIMDPQQRLFLEVSSEALERAGYDARRHPGPIGVFAGTALSGYSLQLLANPKTAMAMGGLQLMVGNSPDSLTTHVSYRLGLRGPAMTVQSHCSTSLVAVHLACQSLLAGECDLALAGGVSIKVPQVGGYVYQDGGQNSPDGHNRSFDARARGTAFGSGLGVVVLKRLADAVRDGDTVRAVIKGSAVNNDGSYKIGFTAPSVEGQAEVVSRALAAAGVDPASIGYLEAHGSATPLGDPIEVAALTRAFRAATERTGFCSLGSVKANLGHLDRAAGVAGLIKTVLCLEHREIPPVAGFASPNPALELERSPFWIATAAQPWETDGRPRRAGVSSIGLGGTNCHVVVEEAPPRAPSGPSRPWQLLVLSARSEAALARGAADLAEHLERHPEQPLADVAFTLWTGRRRFQHRRFVLCRDHAEAVAALAAEPVRGTWSALGSAKERPVVLLFPGTGDQYAGMAAGLYRGEPAFRREIDRCAEGLRPWLGLDLRELAGLAGSPEAPAADGQTDLREMLGRFRRGAAEPLHQTRYAQPLVFAVEYALARLWMALGVRPQALLGYSVGEVVAACVAEVLSLEDALRFVAERARLLDERPAGAMLAVPQPAAAVERRLAPGLSIAAVNSPWLTVVAGASAAVDDLEARLAGDGVQALRLQTTHAFHSALMEPAAGPVAELLRGVPLRAPRIPYIANRTGTWVHPEEAADPESWGRHVCETVRFGDGVGELLRDPDRLFLEAGPGQTLSALVLQHPDAAVPGARRQALPSLRHSYEGQDDQAYLLRALGRLWVEGAELETGQLFAGERRHRVELPTYPFERRRFWIEPPRPQETAPKETAPMTPATLAPPPPASPAARPPRLEPIQARLREIVYEISGVEPERIDFDVPFSEMGVTSLLFVQVVQAIQDQLGIRIAFNDLLETLTTFEAVAEHIERLLPPDDPRFPPAAAPAPVSGHPPLPAAAAGPSGPSVQGGPSMPPSELERVLNSQIQLVQEQQKLVSQVVTQQLEVLGRLGGAPRPAVAPPLPAPPPAAASPSAARGLALPPHLAAQPEVPAGPAGIRPAVFTPHKPVNTQIPGRLTPRQQEYLDRFLADYLRRTPGSRRIAQTYRPWFADNRQSSQFRMPWKEICYQIMVERGAGARLWDVDGNEYVDIGMGFGILLFGHNPPLVLDAIRAQMERGILLGPQTELASRVARLFCELTGLDRVLFCNSGTEAVIAAVRAARTVTRRNKIALFHGSYHGWSDLSAVRGFRRDGRLVSAPAVPGVTPGAAEDTVVLDWAVPESVEILRAHAHDLAAVLIEPVQSRRPDLQPVEMLREIRRITRESGTAFILDEMITGFRSHPGGVQALWGLDADLATYGKGIGGSLAVGAVAGKARFMDAFDGGQWSFGDDSYPAAEKTYFAGAFFKHPFTMAAAWAILDHLRQEGPALQERLTERTAGVVAALNEYLEGIGVPVRAVHFRSLFRLLFPVEWDVQFNILIYHLLHKGVFAWEGGSFFLSTAHTDEDLEHIVRAFRESFEEMRLGGFLPEAER